MSVAAVGQGVSAGGEDDPANLKGERVRAAEVGEALPVERGAVAVAEGLKRLGTRASLMMIVAHPDDEDGGMLTYESRGQGVRVGMLTLTRGEGGQNAASADFDDALGLVRTRELLAADRYMGVDQMFGTEVDFGFSKTKEEAFGQWTHERVLYDAVRAVRLYRPLVVTSVFVGAPSDGHGQHQVSGEIAQEVFNAAADPKVFPEMGLPVWAPVKVYARVPFAQINAQGMFDYATGKYVPVRFENYVTHAVSTSAPRATVMVPEGEFSSLLGKSYVQFAREGLALQKTQIGAGVRVAPAGRFDVGYTRYGVRAGVAAPAEEKSFFDEVDVSLGGMLTLAPSLRGMQREEMRKRLSKLDDLVRHVNSEFVAAQPMKSAPALGDGLKQVDALIARAEQATGLPERERYDLLHELRIKRVQFNDVLVAALGLEMKAEIKAMETGEPETRAGVLVPGRAFAVELMVHNASGLPFKLQGCALEEHTGEPRSRPAASLVNCEGGPMSADGTIGGGVGRTLRGEVPTDARGVRVPYSKGGEEQAFYTVSDPTMRDAALPLPALTAWVDLRYEGIPLRVGQVVGAEESGAYQPVTVVPAVSVALAPKAGVLPQGEKSFVLMTQVKSSVAGAAEGTIRLQLPKGWKATPERAPWTANGADVELPFSVTPGTVSEQPYTITAVAESAGTEYREGFHAVGYPGMVRDNLYQPATTRVRGVQARVPAGLKVAYLPGTGDAVEAAFAEIGIAATTVSVADIAAGRLQGTGGKPAYDALVMGVRAYAAHADLGGVTARLKQYASAGGVVIVQYNLVGYGAADTPYPLSLGTAEKVVEERAAVRLVEPDAQVLRWPNRLTERDFDGWVEERGHGFMGEWAPEYRAVTEVHDAGQDPQRGGLLVAPVGKGAYVYCAYALYRQLPEGVPGAFRLLANLVSLGRRP